ncbi:MAG: MBL fold metallo-hydrolase [Chloroflexota bacterium]
MNHDRDWVEIADRVFARRYAFLDQQIGLVLGDDEGLVIDTRSSPGHGQQLIADITRLTPLPIRTVVDTHWHWDHVFGNSEFPAARIWGHRRCRARLIEHGESDRLETMESNPELAADLRAMTIVPPDHVFDEAVAIDVGGRLVDLNYVGRGHTDADIVATVPDAGVLFAGDLLENDAVPWFGDGYPMDWPATVERLLGLVAGVVVPGHGSVGNRAFVERQLTEFRAVAAAARALKAGRLDRRAALASIPYPTGQAEGPLDRAMAQLRGKLG